MPFYTAGAAGEGIYELVLNTFDLFCILVTQNQNRTV